MKNEIQEFLFIKWLKSDLKDCKDPEIKELYKNYHAIMAKQIEVVE
jgi:hypothetical protein